ncbi:P-loop containing nucleoside triphosphate hydrolase protein [Lentinus tigrinus ALCF2SS1-7]|uniref:P-loop containing nucleoside triphosphate hydrolase protein n=1 Tax=Lentinus tigrinus ALCF2SS1-6 TaxID=1328759 RepID=A0A5C2RWE7_9APHY|nr:P-loop containing nucleoside triphosphate hydrolase protein [Lentinus tigrinus ALCF2SS1-6]RPD73891.1 P-loop containing nucleoside triphosphate hydrolase protein [Lentinus tigrinus ALCF2SS1-7]
MAANSPDSPSLNEKAVDQPAQLQKKGFFSRKHPKKAHPVDDEKPNDAVVEAHETAPAKQLTPVSFSALFRMSTRAELIMNFIGLIAAAAAGASQPLMSLLFSRLTQDFVEFGTELQLAGSSNATEAAAAQAALPAAAAAFKHSAALNASYLVYIGIGMFVCTYTYMVVWVYTGEVNAKRLRERYLQAILRQDIAYFDNVGAGEVATRIQTDTHLVQQGTSEKVAMVVNFLAAFVTGFVLAYVRCWRLALAMSSILPCIGIAGGVMNKFISKYMQLSLQHVAEGGTLAEEVFSTVRTAQAFGTQHILSDLYDGHVDQSRAVDLKAAVWHGAGLSFFFFVIYGAYGLAFNFGTTLINNGEATSGEIINVIFAILIGSFSLALLAPEMQAITQARGAAAKLYETIDRVPTIDSSSPAGLKPEKCIGEISLEHVNFNYPSRPNVPIVKDLSITFPAGKTIALVGASGSGKSTVISLVERFYDPLSGVVKLDGIDLKELNVKWLRRQIGLVSQEPTLFATTIKGNVAHGLIGTEYEHASEEEQFKLIKEACIKANADGFISKLPLGYETMVGERGFLLSGGQKQRIAIARAIVSDPRVLLLDEATSALDTQSEGVVQNALDKAAHGRTTITIAHRLSTIKDADCIYVMGNGLILESGTHEELLRDENGPYARLVQAQKLRDSREKRTLDSDSDTAASNEEAEAAQIEKEAADEIPLQRQKSGRSLASEILEQRLKEREGEGKDYSLYYIFKRLGYLNRGVWKQYLFGAIAAVANGATYPSYGIVFAKGISTFSDIDKAQRRHDGDRNALYFFIIAILSMIAVGFQNYLFASSAAELTSKLRSMSFRAILRQDIEFFDKDENNTGQLTSTLSDNPQKINGLAGITLGAIVQSISTLVIGSIIGLVFNWQIGLVGIACMPVLVSAGYIRLRVVVLKDQQNKKAHEQSAQLACEAAGAIRTVASLTREDDCCRLYSESLEGPLRRSNKTAIWSNGIFSLSQAMTFWVIALVFWYGSRLVANLERSTFQFFIGLMSTTFSAIQAGNVFSFVPDISSAKSSASDVIRLLDSMPEIDAESTEGEVPKDVKGHIRFENVHFRYPSRPGVRVLRDLNLTVQPGTYVALVGASGCGKSTTIQLIERFYDPLAGTVYLDEQPITKYNVSEYRKHIALVSQEPTLYAGTVRFNILLGATKPREEVTQEEIEAACRNANILDFIQSLPDGFDTQVGGKGSQLSGGQKQRIAIARALLRNPKVLLLDEATSALDSNSEKVVQEALDQAAKGRTTIAIAHRLSTIQNADCIYFIKDGAVSESGTHDELLSLKGGYYEYVQLQALSKK